MSGVQEWPPHAEGFLPRLRRQEASTMDGCSIGGRATRSTLLVLASAVLCFGPPGATEEASPLAAWSDGVKVSAVLRDAQRHSIHSYFNTSPESPDGRWVLLYTSTTGDAHEGDIRIIERETGEVRVLASGVTVEDAHRVACQQWISGGRRVVFHDLRDGEWVVVAVDIETLRERVLARGRQVAWGQPTGDIVPLYGPHWDPGEHRDLELLNVATGEIRTVVTAEAVREAYPDWVTEQFGDSPISIFFPILSPDLRLVIFKMATPAGGGFRSSSGSKRCGLICYDLGGSRFVWMHPKWGHPAWRPDSRALINMWSRGPVVIDSQTREAKYNEKLPAFPGGHPSFAPDGRLFTTDVQVISDGKPTREWAVVVGDMVGGGCETIHQFDNSKGAASWRRSHPHPVFSPDGKRLYFNVSADRWTRLYVAESELGD